MLEKMSDFFENRLEGYDEHMMTEIESADEFYPFTAAQLPWYRIGIGKLLFAMSVGKGDRY